MALMALLQWIINLFTNRLFYTRIDDLLSSFVNLISGVIQGSVIGPLMFLIYINDLAMLLSQYKVKLKLFADDDKLYVRVVSDADVTELQMALSAVTSWAEYWQLSVSVDKCGVTYYTLVNTLLLPHLLSTTFLFPSLLPTVIWVLL